MPATTFTVICSTVDARNLLLLMHTVVGESIPRARTGSLATYLFCLFLRLPIVSGIR
jgi:hypothetical protein